MLSILIIEDEKNTAKLMDSILSPICKQIYHASDGISGLNQFKKFLPDIVICDVLMPRQDGLMMSKKIKEISPNTPIIVISAHSDKDKLLKAIDVNVNKYLIKPIAAEELLTSVKAFAKSINKEIKLGKYSLNLSEASFFNLEKQVKLSKKEMILLKALSEPVGKTLSIAKIKQICWGRQDVQDGAVRTFIKRFRDKIGVDIIKSITAQGYKLSLD